jgi:hypothetical protein
VAHVDVAGAPKRCQAEADAGGRRHAAILSGSKQRPASR